MFAINDVTMNNSFFRAQCRMAVFVVALGSVFPVLAQSHKQLVTTVGTAVMDTLAGINLDVSESSPLARHGEVDVQVISSGGQGIPVTHRIRYTPDPGLWVWTPLRLFWIIWAATPTLFIKLTKYWYPIL